MIDNFESQIAPVQRKICFLILVGIFFMRMGCQKDISQSIFSVALIGVPADPPADSTATLREAVYWANRLGANKIVVFGAWNKLPAAIFSPQNVDRLWDGVDEQRLWLPLLSQKRGNSSPALMEIGHIRFIAASVFDSSQAIPFSTSQLKLLRDQLERNRSKPIVFLIDYPLWDARHSNFSGYWWREIHPMLRDSGVKLVVSAYRGVYISNRKKDGITYIQSAGASKNLASGFSDLGNFPHFIWMTFQKNRFILTPIRLDQMVSDSVVISDQVEAADRNYAQILSSPDFPIYQNSPPIIRRTVQVTIANPFDAELSGELEWTKRTNDWRIYPPRLSYVLAPKQSKTVDFNVWLTNFNSINRNLPVLRTAIPPIQGLAPREVRRYLVPLRTTTILQSSSPIVIDGELKEWMDISPILINTEYATDGIQDWNPEDLSVAVYAQWAKQGIYLGVDVKDQQFTPPANGAELRSGDCIEVAIDGLGNRSVTGFDSDDHHFGFAFTEKGPVCWRWHGPQDKQPGRNFAVRFDVRRLPGHTVYEILLPADELAPLQLKKNAWFGFTLLTRDFDNGEKEGVIQWTAGLSGEIYPPLFGRVILK